MEGGTYDELVDFGLGLWSHEFLRLAEDAEQLVGDQHTAHGNIVERDGDVRRKAITALYCRADSFVLGDHLSHQVGVMADSIEDGLQVSSLAFSLLERMGTLELEGLR